MTVFYFAIFLAFLSLVSGILVLLRAGNKPQNRVFFAVSVTSALWSIIFASIELPKDVNTVEVLNKLAYFMGMLVLITGTAFTYYFPKKQKLKSLVVFSVIAFLVGLLSFSTKIAGSVSLDAMGNYVFENGEYVFVYVLVFLAGICLIIRNSVKLRKKLNIGEKSQLDLVMFGYSVSLLLGISLSVIIPYLYPETILDDLAPASLTIMILFTSYAIIKHKLFDFKAVLARSLTYVLTTFFVVAGYVVLAFVVKRFIFPETRVETSQLIANILLTIILVLTYPHIKKRFDRLTNALFFRDSYDPQELIDRLNQTLVTNVNLDELLTKSALILQEEMKTSFCTFFIRQTSYFDDRVIGAHRHLPEFDEIDEIQKLASKFHGKVFVGDKETVEDSDRKLASLLRKNDVDVMVRLTNTLDYEVKGIGYIFLGARKSGSQYGANDLKILEIIANELVIAIENSIRYEEIEQFNVTLQKKIDDATKELKQSNEKLKALDEAKDEFVSMASHQLRTPLTSIKGYISMVLEGDAGAVNDVQKKMLGQAFFSSQRMVYLISDLLNVSRLRTGKFIIETKPVYLPDVVESEINQLIEGAGTKNLTLSFTKPKSFATMNLDEMKLRQVIMNFTDNSIYYTPNGGKIIIELKETPKSVEFTVKDSGIGVPKEQQQKLFTKFYRADNARKARPDGTGLGLFMAKKVIIAQGGSVIFDSKEGKGSTFGFSFPKDRLEVKTEPVVKTDDKTHTKSE